MPVLFPIILLTRIDPLEAAVGQVSGPKLILDMPHHFRFLIIIIFLLTDLHHSSTWRHREGDVSVFFLARDKIGH